ncbi:MAG: hypothetical protein ACRDOJ_06090, partial [Nocardioidaceae bacterium]
MNRYLSPGRCADCGEHTVRHLRCPACGLLQAGPVADDLHAALYRADAILDVLRRESADRPMPASVAPPAVEPPVEPPVVSPRRRGMPAASVPMVLLGLGAVCVLVAAVVFVAVTWTDLSLGWRATILLAVT